MTDALDVRDLAVRFGTTTVFRHLSFRVAQGSLLAIIGPNASGKTVLFRALIGTLPAEGEIRWMPGVRIGYLPQKLDIERDLPVTGRDLLNAKGSLMRASSDIPRICHLVGLDGQAVATPIGLLSAGQFQRLLFALALVGDPHVLLLDEPTAGVDEAGQETMHSLMQRLQAEKGLTILLISHDLSVVYRYAANVLCLSRDHAWFGPPSQALTPERLQALYGAPLGYHVHGH